MFVTNEILNYDPTKTGYDYLLHVQHGFYTAFFVCTRDPMNEALLVELACWNIFMRKEFPHLYENFVWTRQYRMFFSEHIMELALDRLFGGVPKWDRCICVNLHK